MSDPIDRLLKKAEAVGERWKAGGTPRTDALPVVLTLDGEEQVPRSFARTLERELTAAIARNAADGWRQCAVGQGVTQYCPEAEEQARLNGMGSEREARLMARIKELAKAAREYVECFDGRTRLLEHVHAKRDALLAFVDDVEKRTP